MVPQLLHAADYLNRTPMGNPISVLIDRSTFLSGPPQQRIVTTNSLEWVWLSVRTSANVP